VAWDCGAGHYIDFLLRHRLALNIFPFPVTTAKLIGKFYNNRQTAAHGCPRFAYSFVFLMLCQYYWRCDLFSANRRGAANKKKIRENFLLALRICSASPISAKKAPRFAFEHREQRSANNAFYIVPLQLALRRS
jgi:hypothetical protein